MRGIDIAEYCRKQNDEKKIHGDCAGVRDAGQHGRAIQMKICALAERGTKTDIRKNGFAVVKCAAWKPIASRPHLEDMENDER